METHTKDNLKIINLMVWDSGNSKKVFFKDNLIMETLYQAK